MDERGPGPDGNLLRWIRADDGRFSYEGSVSNESVGNGYIRPLRLSNNHTELVGPGLHAMARIPSGIRICFETDSTQVVVRAETKPSALGPGFSPFGLVVNGAINDEKLHLCPDPNGASTVTFCDLTTESKRIEVWLPHTGETLIKEIGLDRGASCNRSVLVRPRWVAYGSSLTQSRFAESPLRTWPALVSLSLGLDLQNRGYAGEAHLDPIIAAEIRDSPADIISLCLGINVALTGSMNRRTFQAAATGFVSTIREAHPDIPIVLIGPTWVPKSEGQPPTPKFLPPIIKRLFGRVPTLAGTLGLGLNEIRDTLSETAGVFHSVSPGTTTYIDGRTLLKPGEQDLLQDGLHFNTAGERRIADRLIPHMTGLLNPPIP